MFAPQCLSTLAVTQRETNSWRWPLLMVGYLFVLAYAAAFATYRITLWLGGWLMVQGLLTALIVAGCAVYVAWALLLPAAL